MARRMRTVSICVINGLCLLAGPLAGAASSQTPFGHGGIDAQHPGSSVLPNEQVDPASGNLTVVATDLVLPGNAGMDLRVTRVYNSAVYPDYSSGSTDFEEDSWAGIGWRLHFGRVIKEDATAGGETQIEMGDGSRHALYHAIEGGWITTDFWRYDKTTHTLKLPNGIVYTFGRSVFLNARLGTVRYVTEIRDPFDNTLTFEYFDGAGPADGVWKIHQDMGWYQAREVTFTYDATLKGLASMTYDGRTWTYTQQPAGPAGSSVLTGVQPPVGPVWQYEYAGMTGELTKLTTPAGGYLTYTYTDATRRASTLSVQARVVATRSTGGWWIAPGTWTYTYGAGSNQDTTIVSCPCGTTEYRFYGTGLSGDFTGWSAGTLAEVSIEDGGTVLEHQTFSWMPSETISADPVPGVDGVWADTAVRKPVLSGTTTTRGPQTWYATHEYHTGLGNYNDYGRPFRTIEQGGTVYETRTTTRTFQYGFTPYIVDRIAQEQTLLRTSFSDFLGPVYSTWTYDLATGFVSGMTPAGGSAVTFEATPEGNVAASTDARGKRTTFGYAWGALADVQTPTTHVTFTVNADGTVAMTDNHVDIPTLASYDALGRPTWVRPQTDGVGVTYEYDNTSARFVRIGGGTGQTELQLDGFGRAGFSLNRVGLKTRVDRDACGRSTFSAAPYTTGGGTRGTTTQYDVLGRITQVTDPAGAITRFQYSGVDVTRIDGETRQTHYDYFAFGPGDSRLMAVTDATGVTTSYSYDTYGNLTRVNGPLPGLTRTWTRDGGGLVSSEVQPESGATSYTYDAVGNLTQLTDANGNITTFTYDDDNRLLTRNAPGTSDDLTAAYDGAGRTTSLAGGGSTTSFTYDAHGRLASRTDAPGGQTFTSNYGYNTSDILTTLTYPSQRSVTYEYDLEYRLTTVKQNGNVFASGFHYDDAGRLDQYVTGAVTHQFTYDNADRPETITAGGAGGLSLTYSYDNVGNVRTITDPRPGASQTFTVDPLDRLTTAGGPWGQLTWTYDAAGNRLTQGGSQAISYTYQAATQRLTSSSGAIAESFTYDNVGQLTGDSRANYTYSPLGRLATAMGPGIAASYTYDAAGTRLAKTVNGQTTYTVRSASGDVLSEYAAPCTAPVWTRDIIYAAGRPLGAIRSTAAQPTVSVTATTASVGEAAGSLTVSFTLTTPGGGALACGVTAAYHTVGGTAASGADYGDRSGIVAFTAGSANNATQTISVPILTDTLDEADETFFLDLTSVIGGAVGTNGRTTVTITDDDPLPALSITDVGVTEGQGGTTTATFTVSLSSTSGRDVQVTYATANGTAVSGADYQPAGATITIPAGQTSYQFTVTVLGDLIAEPTEQFVVNLSNPVNATIADSQGVGTITDDDPVSVSLSANRTFPMQAGNTVIWTASASGATAPYEYQFRLYSATLGAWRVVQDYSTEPTFVWTPALGANYSVQVYVRSAGTGNDHDAEATSATFTITAAPAVVLTSFSPSVSFPVAAGTAVTWTATATGGSVPLQYEFWIYDPWPNTWSVLRGYEASNQFTWTPTHPGDYAFQVWVRAPGSTAAYDAFTGTGSVTITGVSPTLLSLTANRLLPLAPGTTVTWTATAAGGTTPLEYSFLLYRGSTNSWTTERAYSSANTWTWTASTADTYAVQVWARAQGSPAPYDTWTGTGNFTVVSGAITNLALTTTQTFPLAPQAPITWTAQASGGTAALQYQFYLYDSATASWDVVQAWSAANTWTWTPALGDFGVRAVQVWIRSTGSGAPYEAYLGTGYFVIVP